MLEVGSLIDGKYRILSKVGQGGMSVVYMAMNERANKTWAIKEIRKDGSQDFEVVKQGLIVETDMLKRLDHPHLPSIIDVIDGDGSFLIVMDFIEGKTLKSVLDEYGAQPQESVIDWAKQLCDVLGYLHARKPAIIYRDMKPSNVMLKPDGDVVLFDFGTAREYKYGNSEDTTCLGTRGYAAPEQYGGQGQTDARTDIYCLGATMYHLLTGHNPSQPPYEMYPIRQWNPSLSSGLESIIIKCTQKNPMDRYQSCAELLYALDHYWETDIEYRRKEVSKFRSFVVPATLAVAFGIGAVTFKGIELHSTSSNYSAYVTAAHNSTIKESEIANYKKAIDLDPSKSEAYLDLLQRGFLDDDMFTAAESEQLRQILINTGKGKKNQNEVLFKNNAAEYEQFAYELGIAYYYKYENKTNKKLAASYFEIAANSQTLEVKKRERARRLYIISEYYEKIGVADATGDATVSFRDYWNDLVEVSAGNLVEIDNERTALIVYQELVAQIVSRANDFKNSGVTSEEMKSQLTNIELHLQSDFGNVSEGNRVSIDALITNLRGGVAAAERAIQSAFGQISQGD